MSLVMLQVISELNAESTHNIDVCTDFVFVFISIILIDFNLCCAHTWIICGLLLRVHME